MHTHTVEGVTINHIVTSNPEADGVYYCYNIICKCVAHFSLATYTCNASNNMHGILAHAITST